MAESIIRNFYKPIKLFCRVHDIELSRKKITNVIPIGRKFANDRAPTDEEIAKVITYHDRRIKPLVLVTCSSGIRLGAWDYLKWKHIEPIWRNDKVVAAKIIVYAGENEIRFYKDEFEKYRNQFGRRPLTKSEIERLDGFLEQLKNMPDNDAGYEEVED